ncbi:HNH endonuclease [Aeromonas salmonicida]|uniref:HNH endonuclease n=1 Tax=Aeromonas salmonicida TaxID=645 RepID=UPI0038B75769
MNISDEQAKAAYQIAKKVFNGSLQKKEGAEILATKYGLNKNSANDFINNYQCIINGLIFKRNLKTSFIDFFLSSIYIENGFESLQKAIKALKLHVEYWEDQTDTNALSKRRLIEKFESIVEHPTTMEEYQQNFQLEVNNALSLSHEERQRGLSQVGISSSYYEVKTKFFIRNPYVVAATLVRAKGVCEECKCKAPFNRVSDGTPYLEVHHIEPLANGGEDTIQNTVALCPNCHRKFHFG